MGRIDTETGDCQRVEGVDLESLPGEAIVWPKRRLQSGRGRSGCLEAKGSGGQSGVAKRGAATGENAVGATAGRDRQT